MTIGRLVAPLVVVAVAAGSPARADHCDPPPPAAPAEAGAEPQRWSVALHAETARYSTARWEGSWWGLRSELGLRGARWAALGWVPVFQLERNGLSSAGLGDAGLQARWSAWSSAGGRLAAGVSLAITLPTGDAAGQLGMGHVMAMPAAWASLAGEALAAAAAVSYGRSFGAGGALHHHAPGPVVAPMNASELVASGTLGLRLAALRPEIFASLAEPAGADGGQRRAIAGARLGLRVGRTQTSAGVQVPLAGDPFLVRVMIAAAFGLD